MPELILVCGRYEGIDERVVELDIDREVSLGDFVLSGGEPAAIAMCDAIGRLVRVCSDMWIALRKTHSAMACWIVLTTRGLKTL